MPTALITPITASPASLYARALTLALLPAAQIEQWAAPIHGERRLDARLAFDYALARLAAAPLAPAQRERLEDDLVRTARQMAEEQAGWGAHASAALLPHLSPARADQLRALARPLQARWRGGLAERDVVRALDPERYDAWLLEQTAHLHRGMWPFEHRDFMAWLGGLHLLPPHERAQAAALAATRIPGLYDANVTEDHEVGIGGLQRYSAEDARAAAHAAQRAALTALAPFGPPSLHDALRQCAHALNIDIDARLGAWQAEIQLTHRDRLAWLNQTAPQVPAYTLAEKRAALTALSGEERQRLVAEAVDGVLSLLAGKRRDKRFGRRPGAIPYLLDICAPFFDGEQTRVVMDGLAQQRFA